ncbi:protein of unknown function (plasmid) [Azospirillum baldaniorum]|uniref:Uncharacterized protein n=1 Tax=Azospirillum baldaniorum TaxID=1064539 RepID=A0A9P1NRU9_9PROT|nr:protein of unknown function [Azospirillum baldaniorum]
MRVCRLPMPRLQPSQLRLAPTTSAPATCR